MDLSECLQYPDFSVVVLYKKVVIGFGFMVPDVKYNEAYISFLLVHPEWRRAGIGTFMIYHLIQVRLCRSGGPGQRSNRFKGNKEKEFTEDGTGFSEISKVK